MNEGSVGLPSLPSHPPLQTKLAFQAFLEDGKAFYLQLLLRLQQRCGPAGLPSGGCCAAAHGPRCLEHKAPAVLRAGGCRPATSARPDLPRPCRQAQAARSVGPACHSSGCTANSGWPDGTPAWAPAAPSLATQ